MATKKRVPLRVRTDDTAPAIPTKVKAEPKPPEPQVSVFVATRLRDGAQRAALNDPSFRLIDEADACSGAPKKHAQVWVAEEGEPVRPRPPGQRVVRLRRGDDAAAKIRAAVK